MALTAAGVLLVWGLTIGLAAAQPMDEIRSLNRQAEGFYREGKFAEAMSIAQRALELAGQTPGPEVANQLRIVGSLFEAQQDYTKAQYFYERFLTTCLVVYGPRSPLTAIPHHDLARLSTLIKTDPAVL
jgi:Tetratricopeptide repeat